MIFKFDACDAAVVRESDHIVVGVSSEAATHYFTFQRSLPIGGEEDWGVHVEFDDQCNSGYGLVKRCRLSRELLRIDLREPIGMEDQFLCFEIALRIDDAAWDALADGLQIVFAGHEGVLLRG